MRGWGDVLITESNFSFGKEISSRLGDDDCYGGVARHFTKKEELKKGNENNTLYLNAGGMLGGNIWYPILGADPATVAFSYLKYDAVVIIPQIVKKLLKTNDLFFIF